MATSTGRPSLADRDRATPVTGLCSRLTQLAKKRFCTLLKVLTERTLHPCCSWMWLGTSTVLLTTAATWTAAEGRGVAQSLNYHQVRVGVGRKTCFIPSVRCRIALMVAVHLQALWFRMPQGISTV